MESKKVDTLVQVIRKAHLTRAELRELEERIYQLQVQGVRPGAVTREFPPKVPTSFNGLARAVCLLGNRMAADLGEKPRKELTRLIGIYPDLEQASLWKRSLGQKLKQMKELKELKELEKLRKNLS